MKIAIAGRALLTAALCLAPIAAHAALVPEPILGFAGVVIARPIGDDGKTQALPAIDVVTDVYDNTVSAANFGFASTDLAAGWGDRLATTGTGVLSSLTFSLFNSGSSAGPVLTAVIQVDFYDGDTNILIGSHSGSVNFATGLIPGFYSLVTVPNLADLNISIGVTNVVVVQHVVGFSGTANRLGIASLDPPVVGSSPATMYVQASTVGGGIPGFYTIGNGPANPGYQLILAGPDMGVAAKTWSTVKDLYR